MSANGVYTATTVSLSQHKQHKLTSQGQFLIQTMLMYNVSNKKTHLDCIILLSAPSVGARSIIVIIAFVHLVSLIFSSQLCLS